MYKIEDLARLTIGRLDEGGWHTIKIDMSAWAEEMPNMRVGIWNTRYKEILTPYPVITSMQDNVLTWVVKDYDTSVEGVGTCVVLAYDEVKKVRRSRDILTVVDKSEVGIRGDNEPQYFPWAAEVMAARDAAIAAAESAKSSVEAIGILGAEQAARVMQEGMTQVNRVKEEGTAQEMRVINKGMETLLTIPENYQKIDADLKRTMAETKESGKLLPTKIDEGAAPMTFTNEYALGLRAGGVRVNVRQTGDGQSAPDNIRNFIGCEEADYGVTGGNLFVPVDTYNANGVRLTHNDDGSMTISGTATANCIIQGMLPFAIPKQQMTLSYTSDNPSSGLYLHVRDTEGKYSNGVAGEIAELRTTAASGQIVFRREALRAEILIMSGTTVNMQLRVMLNLGGTAHEFTKPIAPAYKSVSLGKTIYGGRIDFANGQAIEEQVRYAFTGEENISEILNGAFSIKVPVRPVGTAYEQVPEIWCSHAIAYKRNLIVGETVEAGASMNATGSDYLILRFDAHRTMDALREFLRAQNAAGTPVTVVYTVETPIVTRMQETEYPMAVGGNIAWSGNAEVYAETYRKELTAQEVNAGRYGTFGIAYDNNAYVRCNVLYWSDGERMMKVSELDFADDASSMAIIDGVYYCFGNNGYRYTRDLTKWSEKVTILNDYPYPGVVEQKCWAASFCEIGQGRYCLLSVKYSNDVLHNDAGFDATYQRVFYAPVTKNQDDTLTFGTFQPLAFSNNMTDGASYIDPCIRKTKFGNVLAVKNEKTTRIEIYTGRIGAWSLRTSAVNPLVGVEGPQIVEIDGDVHLLVNGYCPGGTVQVNHMTSRYPEFVGIARLTMNNFWLANYKYRIMRSNFHMRHPAMLECTEDAYQQIMKVGIAPAECYRYYTLRSNLVNANTVSGAAGKVVPVINMPGGVVIRYNNDDGCTLAWQYAFDEDSQVTLVGYKRSGTNNVTLGEGFDQAVRGETLKVAGATRVDVLPGGAVGYISC